VLRRRCIACGCAHRVSSFPAGPEPASLGDSQATTSETPPPTAPGRICPRQSGFRDRLVRDHRGAKMLIADEPEIRGPRRARLRSPAPIRTVAARTRRRVDGAAACRSPGSRVRRHALARRASGVTCARSPGQRLDLLVGQRTAALIAKAGCAVPGRPAQRMAQTVCRNDREIDGSFRGRAAPRRPSRRDSQRTAGRRACEGGRLRGRGVTGLFRFRSGRHDVASVRLTTGASPRRQHEGAMVVITAPAPHAAPTTRPARAASGQVCIVVSG